MTKDLGRIGSLSRYAIPLICIAQLMATLDVTIVNLALPAVQEELGLSNAHLAWVIDAYTLTYAGLVLIGGRTGDLIGHRRTLLIGICVFTLASLVGGLAPTAEWLLAARAGQGIGAALATPTTLSLITSLCPPGPQRTRAMVAYGAMAGMGITLGLILGGALTEAASWRWVFLVNVPIGLALIITAPLVLPVTSGPRRRIDVLGAITGTAMLFALVYGVIRAGTDGWGDPVSVIALILAGLLAVVFVLVEVRAKEPMLPLHLLRHRTRSGAYLIAGLLFACLYPSFFFLSRALQDVLDHAPLAAGLLFLPIGVGVLVFALAARRLTDVVGTRALVIGGTLATAVSALFLVALDVTSPYVTLLLPALIGLGAGVGTTFVANAASAMTGVAESDHGIASGLLSAFQAVGGTIGVAVLGSIAAGITEQRLGDAAPSSAGQPADGAVDAALMAGFGTGFAIAAGIAAVAVGIAIASAQRR